MRQPQTSNRRLFDIHALSGSDGTEGKIEVPRTATGIIVSVKRGSVDIWFGEFLGSGVTVPHVHYGQTNAPEWLPLPDNVYTITYRLEDTTSENDIVASVILEGC